MNWAFTKLRKTREEGGSKQRTSFQDDLADASANVQHYTTGLALFIVPSLFVLYLALSYVIRPSIPYLFVILPYTINKLLIVLSFVGWLLLKVYGGVELVISFVLWIVIWTSYLAVWLGGIATALAILLVLVFETYLVLYGHHSDSTLVQIAKTFLPFSPLVGTHLLLPLYVSYTIYVLLIAFIIYRFYGQFISRR